MPRVPGVTGYVTEWVGDIAHCNPEWAFFNVPRRIFDRLPDKAKEFESEGRPAWVKERHIGPGKRGSSAAGTVKWFCDEPPVTIEGGA